MHRLLAFQQRSLRLEPLRSPHPLRGTAGVRLSVGSPDPRRTWNTNTGLTGHYRPMRTGLCLLLLCLLCSYIDSNPYLGASVSGWWPTTGSDRSKDRPSQTGEGPEENRGCRPSRSMGALATALADVTSVAGGDEPGVAVAEVREQPRPAARP